MNQDLRHFPRIIMEYGPDEERKARIACVASITAIVMLIVANITPLAIENWRATFAAPPAVSSSAFPPTQPVVAASMPAAVPIFEPAYALQRLSLPVQCYGRSRKGGWIEHSGDRKRTGRRCV